MLFTSLMGILASESGTDAMPCVKPDTVPFWFFVLIAILAHARQTVLLMREVFTWCFAFAQRRRRKRLDTHRRRRRTIDDP